MVETVDRQAHLSVTQGAGPACQSDRERGRGARGLHPAAGLSLLVRAVGLGDLRGEQGQAGLRPKGWCAGPMGQKQREGDVFLFLLFQTIFNLSKAT